MKRNTIISILLLAVGAGVLWVIFSTKPVPAPQPASVTTPPVFTEETPVTPPPAQEVKDDAVFTSVVLGTDKPGAELTALVGISNIPTLMAINRVDDKNLRKGMTIVIPNDFSDPELWEFMPEKIKAAKDIPKLIVVSQRTQSFGLYEEGKLVRSGPVSSGKQDTPTASKLYFTNWKGKEVVSTFSDEWLLKWNFNIDNAGGIGMHQYALPGYPASHSCIRFYAEDAEFIYNWADQWVLAPDGQTELAHGTPVLVYGQYNFKNRAPWKKLVIDPDATKVSRDELEALVETNLTTIESAQALRAQVLGQN